MTGTGDKLDAFINAMEPSMRVEVVRSGVLGIARGASSLRA